MRHRLPSAIACLVLLGYGLFASTATRHGTARQLAREPAVAMQDPATTSALPQRPATQAMHDLAGPFPAEVLRVIDGDTFEARVRIWLGVEIVSRIRIAGIDAPELHGRCAEEKRRAVLAREALSALLAAGAVQLAGIRPDKYNGRVVARVIDGRGRDVGEALVASGQAMPYRGGRRVSVCASRG